MFNKKKRSIKKLGLIDDQEGIISRYHREKEGWDTHLEHTKRFIEKHCPANKEASVAVLGSGWLLDLPTEFLSANFAHVSLCDINHPAQVKHKLRKYENISFVDIDLTAGMVDTVAALCSSKQKPDAAQIAVPKPQLPFHADFVISLNLLNQLDILLVDILAEEFDYTVEELIPLRKNIQQAHLDFLKEYAHVAIFDYKEKIYKLTDNTPVNERDTIFADYSFYSHRESWLWKFDGSGMYIDNSIVHFDVFAGVSNSTKS